MNKPKSYPLLEKAPSHDSPEFIDYLRDNNVVIFENDQWIVIENCKYNTEKIPWYTAFWKRESKLVPDLAVWWKDIDILWFEFGDWEWLKKAESRQTIKRFHIHLIKK